MSRQYTRTGGFAAGAGLRSRRWRQTGSLLYSALASLEHSMRRSSKISHASLDPLGRFDRFKARSGLKTDKANGKILGVCAGIARSLGFSRTTVRVLFLIAAIPMGMLWFLFPLYFLLGFVLDDYGSTPVEEAAPARPKAATDDSSDTLRPTVPPNLRFADLRRQFEDLERRAGSMEREVTSADFTLKRAIRDLDRKDETQKDGPHSGAPKKQPPKK